MCETNHGYFTISLPGSAQAGSHTQPVQGRHDVFGDYGGLPLYTPYKLQHIFNAPGGAPINELDNSCTVPIVGYYENSLGDVWLQIGHDQWILYETEDRVLGQVDTYDP